MSFNFSLIKLTHAKSLLIRSIFLCLCLRDPDHMTCTSTLFAKDHLQFERYIK